MFTKRVVRWVGGSALVIAAGAVACQRPVKPGGIAAVVEDKPITVDRIRREIAPLVPQIQAESRNEKEFNEKLEALQDDVIQNLIDRELIVKDFRKDEKKRIPAAFIDNRISDIQAEEFDNDRAKFLSYLRARGLTFLEARDMLIHAFAGEILDRVKIEPLKAALETELYAQLARDLAEVDAA